MRVGVSALGTGILAMACAGWLGAAQLSDGFEDWRDHPAIGYRTRATGDPVAQLIPRIADGTEQLAKTEHSGYLRSLLGALDVPLESQILVFSKTSLQQNRITQDNPRAIYFNDSVSVAWVRGGFIEIAAQSPTQGVVFYAMDASAGARPSIVRRDECLQCHFSHRTIGVPGMLAPSDHRRPLDQRWGGWYVTGSHGALQHLGNADVMLWPRPAAVYNWPSLERRFDTTGYLSLHSDITAHLVFDHQMRMMNLLSRMGWEARVTGRATDAAVKELVDYMLFVDEAPTTVPIRGSSRFTEVFRARGPVDRKGRSLRDLDLTRRLMKYPCSYMIYSPQFESLPDAVKRAIYGRLWDVLSGADRDESYRHVSVEDRRAIVEILRETKRDLPGAFM